MKSNSVQFFLGHPLCYSKTSYFEPLRDVESDFKFVQFFYTSCTIDNIYKKSVGVLFNIAEKLKQLSH